MRTHPDSAEFIAQVLDAGSWVSWDRPVRDRNDGDADYARKLHQLREATGLDESVITGEGRLRGRRIAVIIGDFRFMAGSIGVAAAGRLAQAITRATCEGLPLLAATASGGTRMQEGTLAFVQMIKITEAIAAHRAARLPYLVYLRHPTTGGVLASWGSLGHVTMAEPGALIGFLGPRVYEAIHGQPFPAGVQTAENLYRHGLIDAIVPAGGLAELTDRALTVLCGPVDGRSAKPKSAEAHSHDGSIPDVPAWDSVKLSRDPGRPGARDLLRYGAHGVVRLNGSNRGETGLLLALARFGDVPCVVLGHDRNPDPGAKPLGPWNLRVAARGLRLAQELDLPLVTVIDTAGAALSREAEEGGLAGEVARTLYGLITLPSPTLSILLGQGTGGGALALLPADRIIACQHAWLSPLPPEGASAILHRTTGRADELAVAQRIRALDLLSDGIIDRIVGEREEAVEWPAEIRARRGSRIEDELVRLVWDSPVGRQRRRRSRVQQVGNEAVQL